MKLVKGYVQRKSMLYKTGVEYGDYTMNHVQGCAHGCLYPCYAYLMKKRFGQVKTYEEWMQPYLVSNTLELLDDEIPRLKEKIKSVHLCFSTDPFMYDYDEICSMSINSIIKLNEENIKCNVLTKGVLPKELSGFSKKNEYGITLITLDEEYRRNKEPHAAPIEQRIESLKYLHDKGCRTWISIEPYPTPNLIKQDLVDILKEIRFVDKIIFGRTNYCKEVNAYDQKNEFYNEQALKVIKFCEEKNIMYHIKDKTMINS